MCERSAFDALGNMFGFDFCWGLQRQSAGARVATATRREMEMLSPLPLLREYEHRVLDNKFQIKHSVSHGIPGKITGVVYGTTDVMAAVGAARFDRKVGKRKETTDTLVRCRRHSCKTSNA